MQKLSRDQVKTRLEQNGSVALVEVLGPDAFREFHLPGAVNVPLGDQFEAQFERAVPDRKTPVIVYCKDTECQASAKAAQKLDELGYEAVYDYEAGKDDWKAAGLPVDG